MRNLDYRIHFIEKFHSLDPYPSLNSPDQNSLLERISYGSDSDFWYIGGGQVVGKHNIAYQEICTYTEPINLFWPHTNSSSPFPGLSEIVLIGHQI